MPLSTQRPTTDIITGLIKSNVPARISLAVSSNTDSRIVLDQSGAEKLLGQGDLLFLPPHTREPMRIQAPYVNDTDIDSVLQKMSHDNIKDESRFNIPVSLDQKSPVDACYESALDFAYSCGEISIKKIQRQFGIGYSRATRIIDKMCEEGIVGDQIGNEPRKIIRLRVIG